MTFVNRVKGIPAGYTTGQIHNITAQPRCIYEFKKADKTKYECRVCLRVNGSCLLLNQPSPCYDNGTPHFGGAGR